jgi:hypothetical protein
MTDYHAKKLTGQAEKLTPWRDQRVATYANCQLVAGTVIEKSGV